ncbi:MAG TPA: addiction module protein [Candidatus Omnitrophica bacterium]|nr:addiction module protein [Candidatus Omnitrophota bacterium]HCI45103.1 addiction module protein [Candidatus Omnitrophota bacterium]
MRIEEYITEEGISPFADWFEGLDAHAANKVNTYLTRIAQGNTSNFKPIKGAFGEVRIDWGPGYRIYVGRDGNTLIILLGGGTKQRQQKDIDKAAELWEEYKKRNKGQ